MSTETASRLNHYSPQGGALKNKKRCLRVLKKKFSPPLLQRSHLPRGQVMRQTACCAAGGPLGGVAVAATATHDEHPA